jgi:hypothetical protein
VGHRSEVDGSQVEGGEQVQALHRPHHVQPRQVLHLSTRDTTCSPQKTRDTLRNKDTSSGPKLLFSVQIEP